MALLEREDQLTALFDGVAAARGGVGSLILVGGEAGSGKSSLVMGLRRHLDDDVEVLAGACDPLTTPRPLSPLVDFAGDISETLADKLESGSGGNQLFSKVLAHLRSTPDAVVMVLEDVHWADDATLDLLRYLGRRIEDSHGVLVATYRDDEVDSTHPLRAVIGQLGRLASTNRITVPPLSRAALTDLAEGSGIDVDQLHRITAGNAFYTTEVIAGGDVLPDSVQDAVIARLQQLESPSRRVVEAVSIAPRSMAAGDAIQLAGSDESAVVEPVHIGLLIDDGMLRFRHEIARFAVASSMPVSRRIDLNRSMLELLRSSARPDLSRLAHHAVEAGDAKLILEFAPQAADEASAKGAHRQAVEFLAASVRWHDHVEAGRLAELRRRLAGELTIVDRHDLAVECYEQAVDHYRRVGDDKLLAETLGELSSAYWRTQQMTQGRSALDEARSVIPPDDTLARAHTEYLLGYGEMLARNLRPAAAAIDRSRELSRGANPPAELAFGQDLIDACIELIGPAPQSGVATLEALLESARRDDRVRDEMNLLHMIGSGSGEARLYEVSGPALAEAVALGTENDEDFSANYARSWQARIAFEQGQWAEATTLAEQVLELSERQEGIAVMTAAGTLGRVRVRRGDPGGEKRLEELLVDHEAYELQHVWSPLCGLAEHLWLQGKTGEMSDLLDWAWTRAQATDSPWARGEVGFWMWRSGAIAEAPDGCAEPFLLHIEGDWRASADAWQELGCPYERAVALADGDDVAMKDALSIFDGLAARPAASWLRARMRMAGVEYIARGPNDHTRNNPAGLTNRQLEVLRLMADGLSNGEIAAALFVSKKTVEHHVSAVFTKLGAADRPKAIAAAYDLLASPSN